MDAAATRLLEIGEAVKALSSTTTSVEPDIKWRQIARMRDVLAHHYFATHPEIIQATIDKALNPLDEAVSGLRSKMGSDVESPAKPERPRQSASP